MKQLFTVSQTYQAVTPESCELGDFKDQGFIFEDASYSIKDILYELRQQGIEHIDSFNDSINIYGWTSTIDYKTGEDETKCLHIKAKPRYIKRLLKVLESRK